MRRPHRGVPRNPAQNLGAAARHAPFVSCEKRMRLPEWIISVHEVLQLRTIDRTSSAPKVDAGIIKRRGHRSGVVRAEICG